MKRLFYFIMFVYAGFIAPLNAQEAISMLAPYDGDTIETKNPLLSWTILGNIQQDNRTYYRLILVELKDEQSAEAGIITNTPLIKMDRYPGNQLFYPYDAPKLEEGHRYGWQIQKITNNVLVDKSEAWEFILAINRVPKPQYYKMKAKNDGSSYLAVGGKLYFEFTEKYNQEELRFYVYNSQGESMDVELNLEPLDQENPNKLQVLHQGRNFYEVNLGNNIKAGNYQLVVYNAKNQKYIMLFEVR